MKVDYVKMVILFIFILFLLVKLDKPGFEGDLKCEHGGFLKDNRTSCNCPKDDWEGMLCNICKNDEACMKDVDHLPVCDRSIYHGTNKNYECNITDEDLVDLVGDKVLMGCVNENLCYVEVWSVQNDETTGIDHYYKTFKCEIFNITTEYDLQKSFMQINAERSHCECIDGSKKCEEEFLAIMIIQMIGHCHIECNTYTRECNHDHSNFVGNIPILCGIGGGCFKEAIKPEDNSTNYVSIISIGWQGATVDILTLVFLLITLSTCCTICFTDFQHCLFNNINRMLLRYNKTKGVSNVFKVDKKNQEVRKIIDSDYNIMVNLKEYYITKWKSTCRLPCLIGEKKVILKTTSKYKFRAIFNKKITAIMGPSGAGKTTLLNIIAGQIMQGRMNKKGEVFYNGTNIKRLSLERIRGFSSQNSFMRPSNKVIDELRFSFTMRNERYSKTQFRNEVVPLLRAFKLESIKNERIGSETNRCISGGEIKRISIVRELISGQPIIILDEPTSGVSTEAEIDIIEAIQESDAKLIILSIHKPSNDVFDYINDIIFMKDGQIMFHAEKNEVLLAIENLKNEEKLNSSDSSLLRKITSYSKFIETQYELINMILTGEVGSTTLEIPINISEYEEKGEEEEGKEKKEEEKKQVITFENEEKDKNEQGTELNEFITVTADENVYDLESGYDETAGLIKNGSINLKNIGGLKKSIFKQVIALTKIEFMKTCESLCHFLFSDFMFSILMSIIVASSIAFLYHGQDVGVVGSQNKMGFICWLCLFFGLISFSSIWLLESELVIYQREIMTGYYYSMTYFSVRVLINIVKMRLLPPILVSTITYWIVGLQPGRFLPFLTVFILVAILSDLVCVFVGCFLQKKSSAIMLCSCVVLFNFLTSGITLNISTLPKWLIWIVYLGFWKPAYEVLMINEFTGITVRIDPDGSPPFPAPGEFWLKNLKMYPENFNLDIIVLLLLCVIYFIASALLFKFRVKIRK